MTGWARVIRSFTGGKGNREARAEEINRDRASFTARRMAEFDFKQSAAERLVRKLAEEIPK